MAMETARGGTPEKSAVPDVLRSITGGRPVYWLPNTGNAGDNLISAATVQMFERSGIAYRCIDDPAMFDSAGKVVCYGGGGNLVEAYGDARGFLARHHAAAHRLVVLPHTVSGHEDLLRSFGPNVTLICRDRVSYAHCRRAAPRADILVADDLALWVDASRLLGWRSLAARLADRRTHRLLARVEADWLAAKGASRELASWRGDVEASRDRDVLPANDIPVLFSVPFDRGLAALQISARFLLRAIDRFETIRTDRLHVAIAGAVLGKAVVLYPGSYFKNRAVYDFSLRPYPNVKFADWPSAPQ
jgi:exopolysaccharide biosynthesis predicted pyruvyltransferase EpsI